MPNADVKQLIIFFKLSKLCKDWRTDIPLTGKLGLT